MITQWWSMNEWSRSRYRNVIRPVPSWIDDIVNVIRNQWMVQSTGGIDSYRCKSGCNSDVDVDGRSFYNYANLTLIWLGFSFSPVDCIDNRRKNILIPFTRKFSFYANSTEKSRFNTIFKSVVWLLWNRCRNVILVHVRLYRRCTSGYFNIKTSKIFDI